jgi:lipopolysaccharide exporter
VIKKLLKNNILKSMGQLTLGTGISQIISFLITPIYTRIYSAESFGIYAIFLTLTTIIVIPATGKLELAIPLPKSTKEAHVLFNQAFIWLTISSLFLGIIILILDWIVLDYLIFYCLITAVFLQGFNYIIIYYQVRYKKYKLLSIGFLVQSLITGAVTIGISFFVTNEWGLVLGYLTGLLAVNSYLYIKFPAPIFFHKKTFLKRFKKVFLDQIDFPKKSVLSSVLNLLSAQSPVLLLSSFYPTSMTGYYFQAQKLLYAPISLIGTSLSRVLYQQISDYKKDGISYRNLIIKTTIVLTALALIPSAAIMIWGKEIFTFLLGNDWSQTGMFASIIMPWIFLLFIVTPLTIVFEIEKKQFTFASFNFGLLITRVVGLYLGYKIMYDVIYSISFFTIASFVLHIAIFMVDYKVFK